MGPSRNIDKLIICFTSPITSKIHPHSRIDRDGLLLFPTPCISSSLALLLSFFVFALICAAVFQTLHLSSRLLQHSPPVFVAPVICPHLPSIPLPLRSSIRAVKYWCRVNDISSLFQRNDAAQPLSLSSQFFSLFFLHSSVFVIPTCFIYDGSWAHFFWHLTSPSSYLLSLFFLLSFRYLVNMFASHALTYEDALQVRDTSIEALIEEYVSSVCVVVCNDPSWSVST